VNWTFIIGAALAAVAAFSVFTAFRSPTFMAGLISIAWDALAPRLLKRMAAAEEAKWRKQKREGRGDRRGER
jgi:hypothetical protein